MPLASAATEIVLAVDSSKLGHRAPARCFDLDRIAILVTELEPGDARLDPYREPVAGAVIRGRLRADATPLYDRVR